MLPRKEMMASQVVEMGVTLTTMVAEAEEAIKEGTKVSIKAATTEEDMGAIIHLLMLVITIINLLLQLITMVSSSSNIIPHLHLRNILCLQANTTLPLLHIMILTME
jgi:hypothetical protein